MSELHGLFGRPYVPLGHLIDDATMRGMHEEISRALLHLPTSYTGGSLKHMGVVAPWQLDDGCRDLMFAIREMSRAEFEELAQLNPEWPKDAIAELDHTDPQVTFGDETSFLLSPVQERWLELRHGVYFPWKVVYHLLENDRWEDKHRGEGKTLEPLAEELLPRCVEVIRALPFQEVGRVVLFGLMPNDHAPLHRDSVPGVDLAVAQSISIDPRGEKRFYLQNQEAGPSTIVADNVYWFNDMDYHGVLADPFFRYSIRVDGVFEPAFVRDLERRMRR